jgi:hypothetical protein
LFPRKGVDYLPLYEPAVSAVCYEHSKIGSLIYALLCLA